MPLLHKYRISEFRPDIELGPQMQARSAAYQERDSYEAVPLGFPADKEEQAQHHDLVRHKDAFGRSPDLRSVIITYMTTLQMADYQEVGYYR
jgi:hypothetical protein